jgi:hypothetical protein
LGSLALVRPQDGERARRDVSIRAIREGLAFVRGRQVVLGAMTLDMFAVIFGGATALLPIYASEILHVGARGYGLLSSAFEIGTLSMSAVLLVPTIQRRDGPAVRRPDLRIATVAFGLSRSFPSPLPRSSSREWRIRSAWWPGDDHQLAHPTSCAVG